LQKLGIDKDIKNMTKRLKELLAQKQGITLEQLEQRTKKPIQHIKRKDMYHFQCPNCHSRNTKRNGITTQLNKKARYICFDCELRKRLHNDVMTPHFFTMGNEEMQYQIERDKTLNDEQKRLFIEKYTIKRKL